MVCAGHEWHVLGLVCKDHQLGAGKSVAVCRRLRGRLHDMSDSAHDMHVDAGSAVCHVDGRADPLCLDKHLLQRLDEFLVGGADALLHLCGVSADDVDARRLRGGVKGPCDIHHGIAGMPGGHVCHWRNRKPLVHDTQPIFRPHRIAGRNELSGKTHHLVIDLPGDRIAVGVAAIH